MFVEEDNVVGQNLTSLSSRRDWRARRSINQFGVNVQWSNLKEKNV